MRYPISIQQNKSGSYSAKFNGGSAFAGFRGKATAPDIEEAIVAAGKRLEEDITTLMKSGGAVPLPDECMKSTRRVTIDPRLSIKVMLYEVLRRGNMKKADLARMMSLDQKQVHRILDPEHPSTLDQLMAAAALGTPINAELVIRKAWGPAGRAADCADE
jgi:hypothetical protein